MSAFLQDIKYGVRLLVRHRGFTVIAALVLALGIGANTAVFTLINTMLLKPRPGVPDAELVGVFSRDRTQPDVYRGFSYPNYADLRDRGDLFASLTAHDFAMVGLAEGNTTRRVFADVITANYFDTFGVPVIHGRAFTKDEERPAANLPVVILGYGMWQRMGGDKNIVGTTIRLNSRVFNIVGVASRGFGGSLILVTPELFLPMGVYDSITNDFLKDGQPPSIGDRRHSSLVLVGHLKPGATLASTKPTLDTVSAQLEQAYPGENKNQSLLMAPLSRMSVSTQPQTDEGMGMVALLLFAMSGLVLLVASFNLANMLLARGSSRQKEFAIRLAIGGSRSRLVRQLLAESVVLAALGGIVATAAAWWATRLLVSSMGSHIPLSIDFETTPDARILGATMALCLISALLFGLGPAWRHAKTDAVPELKDNAGELTGRRRSRFSTRNLLVMGQLALSLVTLTAAGMFIRSALDAAVADPGFTFERGIMANVDPSLAGRTPEASRQFYERALARLRSMPNVASASASSLMAFGEFTEGRSVQKAGAPIKRAAAGSSSMGYGSSDNKTPDGLVDSVATSIAADYFQTMGLAVKQGREFTRAEELTASANRIAIIDETLAEKLFGKTNALDQLVQWQTGTTANPETIVARVVGVAAPSHHQLFEDEMKPHLYTPLGQDYRAALYLQVRTSTPSAEAEAAMLPDIRRELLALDDQLPIIGLETRPMFRDRNFVLWVLNAGAKIFLAFGVLALFMSVVGVYGVKSYVVARRTREIGIRVALGATPRGVVNMIIKDGFVTTIIGLVIGLGLSVLAGFGIRSMLVGDGRLDITAIGVAVFALAAAATLAAWLPARRATRVSPTLALRSD
jgi:predicted permease